MNPDRVRGILGLTVIVIIGVPIGWAMWIGIQKETNQYWHQSPSQTWDHAPDGWYYVVGGWTYNNTTVWFPMCPSSGSQLHGVWNSTITLPLNFKGYVRLENEVIVEIKEWRE